MRRRLYGVKGPTGVVPPSHFPTKKEPVQDIVHVEVAPKARTIFIKRLPNATPKVMKILVDVADKHGVDPHLLVKRDRRKEIVLARNEAFYRMFNECNLGYLNIGRIFDRDHTTIMHSIHKHANSLKHIAATENGPTADHFA